MAKTNTAMRVASGLLVLTLASTCMIAGTYAKYTTNGNSTDTARVAKFGVVVTGGQKAFSTEYKNGDTVTVKSGENVVAPGTSGTLQAMKMEGNPEVAVHVDNTASVKLTNWQAPAGSQAEEYYCPLEVTVGATTLKGSTYNSMDEFAQAIQAAVAQTSKDYPVNTDMADAGAVPDITWTWAFEGNDDAKDTYLGSQANAKVDITLTTTVTQID